MANPVNRKEAIIAGENIDPVTREEYYLKQLADGSGGGGSTPTLLIAEQTVTTSPEDGIYVAQLETEEFSTEYFPKAITVVFNGDTYNAVGSGNAQYGADVRYDEQAQQVVADWSTYPFCIAFNPNGGAMFATQYEGEYTVEAYGVLPRFMYIEENGNYDVSNIDDVEVNVLPTGGTTYINSNGTHDVTNYTRATVSVRQPSGTINITANGQYDVQWKDTAVVSVPAPQFGNAKVINQSGGQIRVSSLTVTNNKLVHENIDINNGSEATINVSKLSQSGGGFSDPVFDVIQVISFDGNYRDYTAINGNSYIAYEGTSSSNVYSAYVVIRTTGYNELYELTVTARS